MNRCVCVGARLQAYVCRGVICCLRRKPLASFSKFRFDLRVTVSLLSLESAAVPVLSGMNGNRDYRQKAWRADTCCCRLGLFKLSELDGAHNSSWKRNNIDGASYKTDPQWCQQLLRVRTDCWPLIVTLFIVVVCACSLCAAWCLCLQQHRAITELDFPLGFFSRCLSPVKALFVFCMLRSCSAPLDFIELKEYECVFVSASV